MFCSRLSHLCAHVKPIAKPSFHNPNRPYSIFPLSPLLFPLNSKNERFIIPPPSPFIKPHAFSPPRRFISIPTALQPPLVFTALLLALWFYKCLMLVLFQNRIIYMPSIPPFARSERIADYAAACRPVAWRQDRIAARDGTSLAVAVGEIGAASVAGEREGGEERKRVVIIYFQGNGSSLPPRLPALSSILKLLHQTPSPSPPPIYTILALSYRGYWTSTGRASEAGLILDAEAMLAHAARTYPPSPRTRFVLFGHSLGASVALTAAANAMSISPSPNSMPVHGLIVETPFLSIPAMLAALYPQKWLPYHYLAPFLRNHWDAPAALRRLVAASSQASRLSPPSPSPLQILILQAGHDELVPEHHALELERLCLNLGFSSSSSSSSPCSKHPDWNSDRTVQRISIAGALHTDLLTKASGKRAVVEFLSGSY